MKLDELKNKTPEELKEYFNTKYTGKLTPDEDAVLGEMVESGDYRISMERIKKLTKKYRMTQKRFMNAIASLHDKGIIYIPLPDEKNIRQIEFTCARCTTTFKRICGDMDAFIACPVCVGRDGVLTLISVDEGR
jgi:hypothetical protein